MDRRERRKQTQNGESGETAAVGVHMTEPERGVAAFLGLGPTLSEVPVTRFPVLTESCGDDPPPS